MLTLHQLEAIRQRAAQVAAGDVGAAVAAYLAQTDVPALLAEVERLRTVLVQHGIDPTGQ